METLDSISAGNADCNEFADARSLSESSRRRPLGLHRDDTEYQDALRPISATLLTSHPIATPTPTATAAAV